MNGQYKKVKIETKPVAGFVVKVSKDKRRVKVLQRGSLNSDDPNFAKYMHGISNVIFARAGIPIDNISRCLIIIHKNSEADIFVNNFDVVINVQFNRKITREKGEVIYKNEIKKIIRVGFPDIKIAKDDAVIFCQQVNWKFFLAFDFTRDLDEKRFFDRIVKEWNGLHSFNPFRDSGLVNIDKEKIPSSKKIMIFLEGPIDVRYLEKAKSFFSNGLDYKIDIVSGDGSKSGGKNNLVSLFSSCILSQNGNINLFVFDCDAEEEFNRCKNGESALCFPFMWSKNSDNTMPQLQGGVENLFDDKWFKGGKGKLNKEFFASITKVQEDEGEKIEKELKVELRKDKFCEHICRVGKKEDFSNFKPLFEEIKKVC